MPLLSVQGLDFSVGGPLLLEHVDFSIERGERICLIGRNGAGKSTLLRLLIGEIKPDDGVIVRESGFRIARLAQEVPIEASGSVFDVVANGIGEIGELLADYHHVSHATEVDTVRLAQLHERIDALAGWSLEQRVEQVLSRLDLPAETEFAALSGGLKRRVLLAQALVCEPDLLLLDEPTNHLDIGAIAWLEEFLRQYSGALVFITHDRAFLQAVATRIVEIDRGRLSSWPGDYANYLRRREERAHAEAQNQALFDKRLAEEEIWIRQGIKARRTRNEGRVRALEAMRRERSQRRERAGTVKLAVADAGNSGRRVVEAVDVSVRLGGRTLLRDFSTSVLRGDRIGIIGPNGSGKTTLLRVLLGERLPDSGTVTLGTQLEVAYFDQYRAQLREDWSALDNVAEGSEFIEINGQRKHALGYLQDFLFSPERARAPISRLSGGERNRLLLARLFARPSNLLVLDEPTNDLDVETLELLEDQLAAYPGTLLLVSHDRAFLDAVVTSTLVLEGEGKVGDYVGGYTDWERQAQQLKAASLAPRVETAVVAPEAAPASSPPAAARRKLSYKDQRELETLPARIESLEAEQAALGAQLQSPDFFRRPAGEIVLANNRLSELSAELDQAYARWAELDSG